MNPTQTKRLRRRLISLAILLTLTGLFYTEELWRGKHAWEKRKRELVAQGVKVAWADYIPAPIPDEENVFGVPEMQKWFTGRGTNELFNKMSSSTGFSFNFTNRITVAQVTIGLPGSPAPGGFATLRWDDPASRAEAARLLTNALGPIANAPQSPIGLGLMLRQPDAIQPARIFLQCQTQPTVKDLQQFLPDSILVPGLGQPNSLLEFEPAGNNSYRVTMPELAVAADYLAGSESLEPEFALIRRALQRPSARMLGNYAVPSQITVPNFITIRIFAQKLGARAECHFLLGQPEEALRDLTLIHDSCRRILEDNHPMTLVSAMINVAVRSMYANIVADGLRMNAWREPQLAVLETQLRQMNLLPPIELAWQFERLAMSYHLETLSPRQYFDLIDGYGKKTTPWYVKAKNSVFYGLIPRGWSYQNMVTGYNNFNNVMASVDPVNQLVFPDKVAAFSKDTEALLSHTSPYSFLVMRIIPNFERAFQVAARNQSQINLTLVACALERWHLAHGDYPESLDALAPKFLDSIPHDVIGGQPPRYHRADDGKFILYSIGWTGHDNGGVAGKTIADGDWIWPIPTKP